MSDLVDGLASVLDAAVVIGGVPLLLREVVGNLFGLASAVGGMRRRVWAWPVGVVGNALLFTVFLGGVFATPQAVDLYGQAGRQVFFLLVSVYGWVRWRRTRRTGGPDAPAVRPRWATGRERAVLVAAMVLGTLLMAQVFAALDSFGPYPDAWIFTGSLLATYGMARGWTDFWLVWIAVDVVGVPLLVAAGYYPSAVLYLVYAGFVLWGARTWVRAQRRERRTDAGATGGPDDPAVTALG
ncbi:nicotinamide riboside transporter PnuC [Pseudokineococcus basanitobsidens]|uniref:Nicotinamide riboside transporter PnuC n=1 Tax=Pseudokineococcus basanitobsidens TaxID=1926649 RepID=A0ABU8RI11_9ACTN